MNDWTFPKAEKGHGKFWTQNTHHRKWKKKPQRQSWTTNKTPKNHPVSWKDNKHPSCKCDSIPNILPVVLSQKKEETNVSANDVLVSQGSGSRRLASVTWMDFQAVGSDHFTAGLGCMTHRIYCWWFVRNPLGNQLRLVKNPPFIYRKVS